MRGDGIGPLDQEISLEGRDELVAAVLQRSVKTVEAHLSRVYRKLGVANRTELARALLSQIEDEGIP